MTTAALDFSIPPHVWSCPPSMVFFDLGVFFLEIRVAVREPIDGGEGISKSLLLVKSTLDSPSPPC